MPKLTISDVVDATATAAGLSRAELLGRSTCRRVAHPRQVAMMCARMVTGKSLTVIAREFDRDYTTISSGIAAVERRITDGDDNLSALVVEVHGELHTIFANKAGPQNVIH